MKRGEKIKMCRKSVKTALFILIVSQFSFVKSSSVNDCRGVKYAYSAKGLDQSDVPRQPRQGKIDIPR